MRLISLLIVCLPGMTANAYIAVPGVTGKLKALAETKVVCMDASSRQISEVDGQIGPGNYLSVIGNVDDFTIVAGHEGRRRC